MHLQLFGFIHELSSNPKLEYTCRLIFNAIRYIYCKCVYKLSFPEQECCLPVCTVSRVTIKNVNTGFEWLRPF